VPLDSSDRQALIIEKTGRGKNSCSSPSNKPENGFKKFGFRIT
jgi:hypothetical protein